MSGSEGTGRRTSAVHLTVVRNVHVSPEVAYLQPIFDVPVGTTSPLDRAEKSPAEGSVEDSASRPHTGDMPDMTRDEIKLYLDTARADAKASAAEVAKSQAELRADLKEGMAGFAVEVANLKGEFHASIATQTKWIAVMIFGALAAAATLWGILKPNPPAATQPAPYVIYAQPYATNTLVQPAPPSSVRR